MQPSTQNNRDQNEDQQIQSLIFSLVRELQREKIAYVALEIKVERLLHMKQLYEKQSKENNCIINILSQEIIKLITQYTHSAKLLQSNDKQNGTNQIHLFNYKEKINYSNEGIRKQQNRETIEFNYNENKKESYNFKEKINTLSSHKNTTNDSKAQNQNFQFKEKQKYQKIILDLENNKKISNNKQIELQNIIRGLKQKNIELQNLFSKLKSQCNVLYQEKKYLSTIIIQNNQNNQRNKKTLQKQISDRFYKIKQQEQKKCKLIQQNNQQLVQTNDKLREQKRLFTQQLAAVTNKLYLQFSFILQKQFFLDSANRQISNFTASNILLIPIIQQIKKYITAQQQIINQKIVQFTKIQDKNSSKNILINQYKLDLNSLQKKYQQKKIKYKQNQLQIIKLQNQLLTINKYKQQNQSISKIIFQKLNQCHQKITHKILIFQQNSGKNVQQCFILSLNCFIQQRINPYILKNVKILQDFSSVGKNITNKTVNFTQQSYQKCLNELINSIQYKKLNSVSTNDIEKIFFQLNMASKQILNIKSNFNLSNFQENIVIFKTKVSALIGCSQFFSNSKIIIDEMPQKKKFMKDSLENYMKKKAIKTRLLFEIDPLNCTSFHKYIDNFQHVLLVCQLINGEIIGFYSAEAFIQTPTGENQFCGRGFLFSVTKERIYLPKETNTIPINSYDPYSLIFGKTDIRIQSHSYQIYSNFGFKCSMFDCKGQTTKDFFNQEKNQIQMKHFEIYQVVFA